MAERLVPMPVDVTIKDLIRFWSKVDRSGGPDACWPWTGLTLTGTDTYGSVVDVRGVFNMNKVRYIAPRVSYFFHYKQDPGRLLVCHECNRPICVNPTHLFLGTQGDNLKHMADSGRCARGSFHSSSVLDESDIPRIRARLAAGETMRSIAKSYGVSHRAIGYIHSRQTWSHVE